MEKGKTIHRWGIQENDHDPYWDPDWQHLGLNFYGTWEEAVTECAKLARLGKRLRPVRLPRDRLE